MLGNIKDLVCSCPIVEIEYLYQNKVASVFAECSWYSLTGSIKDRVAYQILKDAYNVGDLKCGDKIVEVSSGNMGISLTAVANLIGNSITIIMPKGMSEERKKLLKMYGAELVEVENFREAFSLCDEYMSSGYFCPRQFKNLSNVEAHYDITGMNFVNKLKDLKVDNFVAGIGTSGTLIGAGKKLKESLNVKVVAIEPENARIITGGCLQKHKLQGLSDEILPDIYDKELVDDVIQISDNDAIAMAQKLCKVLSLGVGISSGANFLGCVLSNGNSSTVFADDNKKYLSTGLTIPICTKLVDEIKILNIRAL